MKNLTSLILFTVFLGTQAEAQVYFSPNGGCEQQAILIIQKTQHELDVAMYSFNNPEIVDALKRAKKRGVKIRILLDRSQAGGNLEETLQLKKAGFEVKIHSHNRIQHNKFAISDDQKVMTGSFNWTTPAEKSNEENCLFLKDPEMIQAYQTRFDEHLWPLNSEWKSKESFKKLKAKKKDALSLIQENNE